MLKAFVEHMDWLQTSYVYFIDPVTGQEVRAEVESGRLDGGWTHWLPDGTVEHGKFWREPGGPLESVTEHG